MKDKKTMKRKKKHRHTKTVNELKAKGQKVLALKCKLCKKIFYITINIKNENLYTEKVKRNWHCLSCNEKIKGGK